MRHLRRLEAAAPSTKMPRRKQDCPKRMKCKWKSRKQFRTTRNWKLKSGIGFQKAKLANPLNANKNVKRVERQPVYQTNFQRNLLPVYSVFARLSPSQTRRVNTAFLKHSIQFAAICCTHAFCSIYLLQQDYRFFIQPNFVWQKNSSFRFQVLRLKMN